MRAISSLLPKIEQTLLYRHDLRTTREPDLAAGMKIEQLSEATTALLRQVGPTNSREVRERVERGDSCYIVRLANGQTVHYAWVQRSGRHHMEPAGIWQTTADKEAWIYDCRTAEHARGKHIYPSVLAHILVDLKGDGVEVVRIYTTRSNVASQHGIVRAGFLPVTRYTSLRLGSRAVLLSRASVRNSHQVDGTGATNSIDSGV